MWSINTKGDSGPVYLSAESESQIQFQSGQKLETAKYTCTLPMICNVCGFHQRELDATLFDEGLDIIQVRKHLQWCIVSNTSLEHNTENKCNPCSNLCFLFFHPGLQRRYIHRCVCTIWNSAPTKGWRQMDWFGQLCYNGIQQCSLNSFPWVPA